MPLRAFGDIRYKLPVKVLKEIANRLGMPPNYPVCPRFYHSPPYLVATPQVICRRLDRARDRFIILATDGLWDMLTPEEAVAVVGQHFVDYNFVSSPILVLLHLIIYHLISGACGIVFYIEY